MNGNVRRLTDGAMMTAIIGLLLVINRQLGGVLVDMLMFLFPLPMVFYSAKYGMKDSWLVFAAISILAFILGTPATMFYVASESLIGIVYGSGIRKKTDSRRLLFLTMFASIVVNIFTMLIFAKFFGYDLTTEISEYKVMFNKMVDQTGVVMPANFDLTGMLRTLLIVSVFLTGVLQGLITHLSSRLLLKRLRFSLPPATPLLYYFPPVWSGYLGIAGLVAYYASILRPIENELLQGLMQGFGICGVMYLWMYGLIAVMIFGRILAPKSKVLVLFGAILLSMIMMLGMVIIGFLYITTGWHRTLVEGINHAQTDK